ncbi:MAG: malto-oligosyltrehalose synthase [Planctomycetota bacterium]
MSGEILSPEAVAAIAAELAEATVARLAERVERPVSTYRLQFHPEYMRLENATEILPYLRDLGVSHLYASPIRRARSGSEHGYAIVDYGAINPELGGEEGYRQLVEGLEAHGLGHLVDIVPNHMSAKSGENLWWTDLLENGPSSPYARYFDVNWQPQHERMRNKVLLPTLGEQYGQVLEAGELRLEYGEGAFRVRYWETALPLDPKSYALVLRPGLELLKADFPPESQEIMELESILTAIDYLPATNETAPLRVAERQREKEVIKHRLRQLVESSPEIAAYVERALERINGNPEDAATFDELDRLLDAQPYRLAHWKAAADEINYRRFFDINELAAVCMEDPEVFQITHTLLFDFMVRGDLSGLRIDHVDGLFDPTVYLWRLQWGLVGATGKAFFEERFGEAAPLAALQPAGMESAVGQSGGAPYDAIGRNGLAAASPSLEADLAPRPLTWEDVEVAFFGEAWKRLGGARPDTVFPHLKRADRLQEADTDEARGEEPPPLRLEHPVYVVVEKILNPDEPLPSHWPVAGTTGYDFLAVLSGLFVDPQGLARVTRNYARFIDESVSFSETALQSKTLVLRMAMSSELMLLAHRLNRLSEEHRRFRDFTLNTLRAALREILTCFPVYRTYLSPTLISERDRRIVHRAVAQAKHRNQAMPVDVFDFIRDVLFFEQPPHLDEEGQRERAVFVGRFQQVTSPVMAKGVEDTAFYRYVPLCSLNEVGGDPNRAVFSAGDFHRENLARHKEWPGALLATTTHDTKRSEDVRARIHVLSEVPSFWQRAISHWSRLNRRHRIEVNGQPAPSRNDEYLFYQTLVGVWPLEKLSGDEWARFVERLQCYMEKASREAKLRTSWLSPNAEYEAALRDFIAAALKIQPQNRFLTLFREFQQHVMAAGQYTALSQLVLKLMSPGTPDIYQGQEIWELTLVDPDNRRPVDFSRRRWLLGEVLGRVAKGPEALAALAEELAQAPTDDRLKIFITWRLLQLRRTHRDFFRTARYEPLEPAGERAEHLCAFAWRAESTTGQPPRFAAVLAPRLLGRLMRLQDDPEHAKRPPLGPGVWLDTSVEPLQPGATSASDVFTAAPVDPSVPLSIGEALRRFPVAVVTNLDETANPAVR